MITTLSARRLGSLLITMLVALFVAGCASAPEKPAVDWNSRVGNYTYDQAKAELGAPSQSRDLPGGGKVVEWLTRRNAGTPGMEPLHAGGVDQTSSQALTSLPKSEYLVLTFDTGGKLVRWARTLR